MNAYTKQIRQIMPNIVYIGLHFLNIMKDKIEQIVKYVVCNIYRKANQIRY